MSVQFFIRMCEGDNFTQICVNTPTHPPQKNETNTLRALAHSLVTRVRRERVCRERVHAHMYFIQIKVKRNSSVHYCYHETHEHPKRFNFYLLHFRCVHN